MTDQTTTQHEATDDGPVTIQPAGDAPGYAIPPELRYRIHDECATGYPCASCALVLRDADVAAKAKAEFDEAVDTLLGSVEGRKQLLLKAKDLGLLEGQDSGMLACLFFTNPDFARRLCDTVWAASQKRGAA